ncbi:MAG: MFS transporter [Solirubrobacterales bacterium]|nr:MFS transporter [Solirubrobacterales bacterium]
MMGTNGVTSHLRVLRERSFRYLFLGQAASVIGDRLVFVALALFVTRRTGSPTDLGLVLAAATAPLVLLLPFGGVWADRVARHRIMVVTDLIRAALHAGLAALILVGEVRIWEVVAIEACFGAAQAFFQPAYTGLVPQTVPEALIQEARAVTESMANLATLLGPALATLLVLGIGAGEAFAVDAATFVLSAALLTRVNPRARGRVPASARVLDDLRAGWREVVSRRWVWVTIVTLAGAMLCVDAQWFALAPSVAREHYGGVGVFGWIETVLGAGAVAGSLAGLAWRPRHPLRTGLLIALAVPLLCVVFALLAPLVVVLVMALGAGVGFSLFLIWWETALAHHVPPHALSRVSSYDWMGSLVLLPVGYLVAGPLASAFGARTVLGVGGAVGLVLTLLALAPRATRQLTGPGRAEQLAPQPSSPRAISA